MNKGLYYRDVPKKWETVYHECSKMRSVNKEEDKRCGDRWVYIRDDGPSDGPCEWISFKNREEGVSRMQIWWCPYCGEELPKRIADKGKIKVEREPCWMRD